MADFTGMYDDGTDLDERLLEASYLLKQASEDTGIDLNQFDDRELAQMVDHVADEDGDEDYDEDEDEDEDDEDYEDDGEGEKMSSAEITVADVSLELTKRAAAEGIDLSRLHPQEYHQLFDNVAAEMSDPYYAEEASKFAAQAENMDTLGRIAARSFVDEINKLAADEEDVLEHRLGAAREILLKSAGVKDWGSKAWGKTKELAGKAHKWEQTQHGRLGGVIRGKKRSSGDLAEFGPKNTRAGRIATGTVTGGTAAGVAYARSGNGKGKKRGGRR